METRLQAKQTQELERKISESSKTSQTEVTEHIQDIAIIPQNMSSPDPKMPKFSGDEKGLQIVPFLNIFDRLFNSLSDNEKINKLIAFLEGEAANYFGMDIIALPSLTWQMVRDKLIDRFGHSDIPPMMAASRRKLNPTESIKQYYDEKSSILRRIVGLTESDQSDALTEGLPNSYKQFF